ncbi:MAG: 3'-5' exoribonuclease YhaM family protein [Candidatus Aenigmatarchaeota archaeon]
MKRKYVEDLNEGDEVKTTLSVKYKKPIRDYKNGYMFTLGLADMTDEIEAKYWGGKNEDEVRKVFDSFQTGDVVEVRGNISKFRNNLQINIEEGSLEKTEEFDIEDFVPSSDKDVEELFSRLEGKMRDLENEHLRRLMDSFLNDEEFVEDFKGSPAAMYYHHAYIGGLVEHVLHMIEIGEKLSSLHEELDDDLIKVGCFLHDLGKMEEFSITTNIKQSRKGLLTGHITLGQEMLIRKIDEIEDFPENLKHKLLHILISHHGKTEYGAVKEPMFPEALAIHYIDELDSQVVQMIDLKKNAETEDFHTWTGKNRFGQIYLE